MVAAPARIVRIVVLLLGIAAAVVERTTNTAHARRTVDRPFGTALPRAAPASRQLPRSAALFAPTAMATRTDRRCPAAPVGSGGGRTVTACFLLRRKPRLVGFLEVGGEHLGEDELPGARLGVVVNTVLRSVLERGTLVGRVAWG